ncbi:MAG TPA: NAD(P)H-dependent oxidoreductase [Burkholderiaceae bacterium]|nr:NAD(P)H-dependent oxidoreductase [Burkholderiaceae bacterium]
MPRILILLAHPHLHLSRAQRRMAQAVRSAELPGVTLRDLYALYPDYVIDVKREQAALAEADLLVWQQPIQWYSMPALLKLWVDEVLAHGWAYGRQGQALRGKDLWLVASTGGAESAYHPTGYNRYFFDAFLPPYEQTATLCRMRFLPPMVLHGAHQVDDVALDAHAALYVERLRSYPDWPELAELPACPECDVPAADRPAS